MLSQFLSKVQTGTKCATIHQNIEIQQFFYMRTFTCKVIPGFKCTDSSLPQKFKSYQLVLKSPAG